MIEPLERPKMVAMHLWPLPMAILALQNLIDAAEREAPPLARRLPDGTVASPN
jgi:hypothetical protein